jgi:hypothetical protein
MSTADRRDGMWRGQARNHERQKDRTEECSEERPYRRYDATNQRTHKLFLSPAYARFMVYLCAEE